MESSMEDDSAPAEEYNPDSPGMEYNPDSPGMESGGEPEVKEDAGTTQQGDDGSDGTTATMAVVESVEGGEQIPASLPLSALGTLLAGHASSEDVSMETAGEDVKTDDVETMESKNIENGAGTTSPAAVADTKPDEAATTDEDKAKGATPLPAEDKSEDSDDVPLVTKLQSEKESDAALRKQNKMKEKQKYFKSCVGKKVRKFFEGYGYFNGKIDSYEDGLFHVVYNDGDEEDMNEQELITLGTLQPRKKKPKIRPTEYTIPKKSVAPDAAPAPARKSSSTAAGRGGRPPATKPQQGISVRGVDFKEMDFVEVRERPGQVLCGRTCHEACDWRKVRFMGLADDKGGASARQLITVKSIDNLKGTTADNKEKVPIGWIRPLSPARFATGTYSPGLGDLVEALLPAKEESSTAASTTTTDNSSLWWAGKVTALRTEGGASAQIERPDKSEQVWVPLQKVRLSTRWMGGTEFEARGRGDACTWPMDKIEEAAEFEKITGRSSSQSGASSATQRWWAGSSDFDYSFMSLEALAIMHHDARLEHLRGMFGQQVQILGAINETVGGRRFRPEGDWQPGKLVSMDAVKNTAFIRYDDVFVDDEGTEQLEETVPFSYVRPCPPTNPASWAPARGDILGVKLLDKEKDPDEDKLGKSDILWYCKLAELPRIGEKKYLVARPDGIEKVWVKKADLYPGLTWVNGNEWIPKSEEKKAIASASAAVLEAAKKACENSNTAEGDLSLPAMGGRPSKEWYNEQNKWRDHRVLMAVDKALDFVFEACDEEYTFLDLASGGDCIQWYYDVANVAPEPVRQTALHHVEELSQRWKNETYDVESLGDNLNEVLDSIMGIYALERVGIQHAIKTRTIKVVEKKESPVSHYLGFDPRKDGPDAPYPSLCSNCGRANEPDPAKRRKCAHCSEDLFYPCMYSRFTTALTNAFYCQKTQHPIGAGVLQVLKHTKRLRPYRVHQDEHSSHKMKRGSNISWEDFDAQCQSVYNIVHCLSSYGELQLSPDLLPYEFEFLTNMQVHRIWRDEESVHHIGELLQCLKVFGVEDDHPLISKGMHALLRMQDTDAAWGDKDKDSIMVRYRYTNVAVLGLIYPNFRGYGPAFEEVLPLLRTWQQQYMLNEKGKYFLLDLALLT
jgi:hypothetical protein